MAGHNVRSFDLKFINKAEAATGIDVQSSYYVDTLRIMRRLNPKHKPKTLAGCADYYGIAYNADSLHDALVDTTLTVQIMLAQFEELHQKGIVTFSEMLDFLS